TGTRRWRSNATWIQRCDSRDYKSDKSGDPRAVIQYAPNVRPASCRERSYLLTERIPEPDSPRNFQGTTGVGDVVDEGEAFNKEGVSMLVRR
ncbi:hypothetical protein LTR72_012219, partial [Exophiala xenobiotica]